MTAYIATYRHCWPKDRELRNTEATTASDASLAEFLDRYFDENNFYDWGDDPAFFCAEEFLGDARRASWGVCRANLRSRLSPGDYVVFFCAKPRLSKPRIWDYHYVGVGTIGAVIDRQRLWSDRRFRPYRKFYNVLARPKGNRLVQAETFHPFHKDWRRRLLNYVIFDPSSTVTDFNLTGPVRVATYDSRVPERWKTCSGNKVIRRLEDFLFRERQIDRRLRTSPIGFAHPHINLESAHGRLRPGRSLPELRKELLALVK